MEETKINYEKLVTEAILDNKVVYIEKHDGVILFAKHFNSKDELIDWFVKEVSNYTEARYLTAEEAYVEACNIEYIDFLQDFEAPFFADEEEKIELTPFELREKLKTLTTYEEAVKDIDKTDYVDGIYDYRELLLPINLPKPSKLETTENVSYNNFEASKKVKVTLEVY